MIAQIFLNLFIQLYYGTFSFGLFYLINKITMEYNYMLIANMLFINYLFYGFITTMYIVCSSIFLYLAYFNVDIYTYLDDNYENNFQMVCTNYHNATTTFKHYELELETKIKIMCDNPYCHKIMDGVKIFTDSLNNISHQLSQYINTKFNVYHMDIPNALPTGPKGVTDDLPYIPIDLPLATQNFAGQASVPQLPINPFGNNILQKDIQTKMDAMSTMMEEMNKFNKLVGNLNKKKNRSKH